MAVIVPPPPPAGVAHVPSPRQNVVDDAPVPLLRLVTGRLPVTPVLSGRPVAFVNTAADGVPKFGVTSVGLFANTFAPVPVPSVSAAAKFALVGVAKNVATPVPSPDTPVLIGKPVAFVSVAEDGVPRAGVTKVGLLDNTTDPEPVDVVVPVPPAATGNVPAVKAEELVEYSALFAPTKPVSPVPP